MVILLKPPTISKHWSLNWFVITFSAKYDRIYNTKHWHNFHTAEYEKRITRFPKHLPFEKQELRNLAVCTNAFLISDISQMSYQMVMLNDSILHFFVNILSQRMHTCNYRSPALILKTFCGLKVNLLQDACCEYAKIGATPTYWILCILKIIKFILLQLYRVTYGYISWVSNNVEMVNLEASGHHIPGELTQMDLNRMPPSFYFWSV